MKLEPLQNTTIEPMMRMRRIWLTPFPVSLESPGQSGTDSSLARRRKAEMARSEKDGLSEENMAVLHTQELRTIILTTFFAIVLLGAAVTNAFAQGRDMGCSGTVANPCGGSPSSGSRRSAPSSPRADPAEEARERRRSEALAANSRGVAFQKQGEHAKAVAAYQEAADKAPDDEIIRVNLVNAKLWLEHQLAEEKAEREAAEAKLKDKAAANKMQQSIQDFAKTLNAAPSSGGLDFDGAGSTKASNDGSKSDGLDFTSRDPSVVDARNVSSGLPKAMDEAIAGAYKDAPAGVVDRVRKGFQAVMGRDWKVARAWFEDALNRDPNNAGLKRLFALTDSPQPSNRQNTTSDKPFTNEAIPPNADKRTYAERSMKVHSQEEWRKFLFPDEAPVLTKLPDGRRMYLQKPADADMEFLFDTTTPAPKPTPTFIIGKDGQLIQVPENSDQKSSTYIKGKDGKLMEVPQPSDVKYMFPGTTPAATTKPAPRPEPKDKKP
jgi:tetratricopeptide (TPR) repeat protein